MAHFRVIPAPIPSAETSLEGPSRRHLEPQSLRPILGARFCRRALHVQVELSGHEQSLFGFGHDQRSAGVILSRLPQRLAYSPRLRCKLHATLPTSAFSTQNGRWVWHQGYGKETDRDWTSSVRIRRSSPLICAARRLPSRRRSDRSASSDIVLMRTRRIVGRIWFTASRSSRP